MSDMFLRECPDGHEAKKGAKYCAECGIALDPAAPALCRQCGETVPADTDFCKNCGPSPWACGKDDFATRIEPSDPSNYFANGLIIEEGTKALFFLEGTYSGVLDPGKYDIGELANKIVNLFDAQHVNAVLVNSSDVPGSYNFAGIRTSDPIEINLTCELILRLENSTKFFDKVMKHRYDYKWWELSNTIQNELRSVLQQFIGRYCAEQLVENFPLRADLENSLGDCLRKGFEPMGLSFARISVLNFYHRRAMNRSRKWTEEYWFYKKDLDAQPTDDGILDDTARGLLDQKTAKMLREVAVFEARAWIWLNMFTVMTRLDEMFSEDNRKLRRDIYDGQLPRLYDRDEIRSENDFKELLQDVDEEKLLRSEEIVSLVQMFRERKENYDLMRRHLGQKMYLEHLLELERIKLLEKLCLGDEVPRGQKELELQQLEYSLDQRRQLLKQEQEKEWFESLQKRSG